MTARPVPVHEPTWAQKLAWARGNPDPAPKITAPFWKKTTG